MLATVTNRARSTRGFVTAGGGTVLLEPGASGLLDLVDHALHKAWSARGEVLVVPLSDKDAKAARRRLDAETDDRVREQAAALARLGTVGGPGAVHPAVD